MEEGFDHQTEMPETPGPDGLPNEQELARKIEDLIPESFRERALADRPIELRTVKPYNPLRPKVRGTRRQVWTRAAGALPDDPAIHQYLLAYASDFQFMGTSMQPHGVSWLTPGMQVASLDHSMWFHRPFRMDEWLLHDIGSPSASGARGLVRGAYYTADGALVASTAQEGLIRDRR